MARDKQIDKVLAGSLNLRPPVDLLPQNDALAVHNFRPDQVALLRSRKREAALDGISYAEPIRSLFLRTSDNSRYVGGGGKLYRSGVEIASGFDSWGAQMVEFLGSVWVMNQALQGRHSGGAWLAWLPTAPATAPDVVASTPGGGTSQAIAYASIVGGGVASATIVNGGSGYPSVPNVAIQGDGSNAAAHAVLTGGVVTSIVIDQAGALYHGASVVIDPPPAPAAGPLTGTYNYYVSFDTVDGHESDLSPVSDPVSPNSQNVILTNVATSPDPQVTMRHIYRDGGNQGDLYRVADIPDNTTTTFTDTMDEEDAARQGITHAADHQPPPAAHILAGPYNDKLLAANSQDHPNWFWWTDALKPYYFPGSNLDEGNHAPVGQDGENIYGISIKPLMVIFYTDRAIYRMVGDPDDASGQLERTNSTVGILGPRAWCSAGAEDYIVGSEGVYVFNADRALKFSPKLDPLFRGEAMPLGGVPVLPMTGNADARSKTVIAHRNGRLYLSYADSAHLEPNTTLVCDLATGNWMTDDRGFSALLDEGQTGLLVGAIGNQCCNVEASFSGTPINLVYQGGYRDQGAPLELKRYPAVEIDYDTGGQPLQLTAGLDAALATTTLGTLNSNGRTVQAFAWPDDADGGEGLNCALRIEGTVTSEVRIYGIALHWYLYGLFLRAGTERPLPAIDLGTKRMKLFRRIEFLMRGAINLELLTDVPGGNLVSRATAAAVADTTQWVKVPTPSRGKQAELRLSAAKDTRIYAIKLRWKPIGEAAESTWQWADLLNV